MRTQDTHGEGGLSMLNKSVTKVVTFVEDRDERGCLPFSHSYTALREVSVSARRPRPSPGHSGRQGQADFCAVFCHMKI